MPVPAARKAGEMSNLRSFKRIYLHIFSMCIFGKWGFVAHHFSLLVCQRARKVAPLHVIVFRCSQRISFCKVHSLTFAVPGDLLGNLT